MFLPPSCASGGASGVANATLLVLGDFAGCPFWSADASNHTVLNATTNITTDVEQDPMHPRFRSVFANNSAADAVGNASLISPALADAIATRPQQPPCGNATNAMITVLGGDAHQFFLARRGRLVAALDGVVLPRAPAVRSDRGRAVGVAAALDGHRRLPPQRRRWLMADSAVFFAHFDMASPTVPEMVPAFDGDWSDDGVAPFWSGAHPAGLRALRDAFTTGVICVIAAICVAAVIVAVVVHAYDTRRMVRIAARMSFLFFAYRVLPSSSAAPFAHRPPRRTMPMSCGCPLCVLRRRARTLNRAYRDRNCHDRVVCVHVF